MIRCIYYNSQALAMRFGKTNIFEMLPSNSVHYLNQGLEWEADKNTGKFNCDRGIYRENLQIFLLGLDLNSVTDSTNFARERTSLKNLSLIRFYEHFSEFFI